MTDLLLRMLLGTTLGLALALLLRRPVRRVFGAGPAFTLWLLPVVLALAQLLPNGVASAGIVALPVLTVMPPVAPVIMNGHMEWPLLVCALWLSGAALGIARLAWHYMCLRRSAQRGLPAWLAVAQAAAADLDLRRVRVHAAGPAVLWALPRSLVLLPDDFAQRFGNVATRELVLRHEITHARRGDAWWTLAMEIASALLWFHPLAWLARSRFRLDQELACDATALRAMPNRTSSYARALLDSVAVQPALALIPWLAEPQLKERIAMLTHTPPGALRRRAGFVAIAWLLAGSLLVAGGRTSADAATPASSRSATPAVDITYKNRNPPKYPVAAIKQGEQGDVVLRVTIDAGGNVTKVAVDPAKTTAPGALQSAAIAAAVNWKFAPGIKDGHPVGGVVEIPVNFALHEWESTGPLPCLAGYKYAGGTNKSYTCSAQASTPAAS